MDIENREISFARTRIEALENELAHAGDIGKREIFRRRSHENQVVVLGVIQREQRPSLHAKLAIEKIKHTIQLVNREDLSDTGVVIEDESPRIGCWIEIPHSGFGTSHKTSIAKNDPRLLWTRHEAIPEKLICRRRGLADRRLRACTQQEKGTGYDGRCKQNGQNGHSHPPRLNRGSNFDPFRFRLDWKRAGRLRPGTVSPPLECERIRSLRNFYKDRIVDPIVRIIFGQLDAQPTGLNADRGIALRIESCRATQNLGGDLIFLERDSRVIERMLREITEKSTKGFRAVEAMAFGKSLYLLEALLPAERETVCYSHITGK